MLAQPGDHVAVLSQGQFRLDEVLEHVEPMFVQAGELDVEAGTARQILASGVAVPQPERRGEMPYRIVGVAGVERAPAALGEVQELLRIDLAGFDPQPVPAGDRNDPVAEKPPQRGDMGT
jgi:hypothetical protein